MSRCLLAFCTVLFPVFSLWAEKTYRLGDFRVRDPFIVNAGGERPYLLFMSDSWRKTGRGSPNWCAPGVQTVSVSRSADLVRWSEPETCMTAPKWCGQIWAPEIHEWKGKWYMFVTLKERHGYGEPIRSMVPGEPDWEYCRGSRTNSTCHALWMYRADHPEGPYLPIVDKPLTEKGYISLDGTLGVEDGKPWMIYTHDWAQIRVGTYELRPLSDDFTHFTGPAKTLFTAAAMPMRKGMGVTDGAFLYRSPKSGKLFMTWSTHDPSRPPEHDYCVVLCESATGMLAGPWVKHRYLSSDASGHGHFFRDKHEQLRFVMHDEHPTDEHVRIFEVIDDGDTLRFGQELCPECDKSVSGGAKPLKVLAVGNSFSWQLPVAMPPVAKALGLELDICALFIGGCSLETHWKNVCAPATKPYRVIRNRFGVADKDVQGNIPDVLESEPWDVITVQQVSGSSWIPETYHPWGDDLVKYIREKAPQAKILVQETWSYTAFDKRFAKWGIDQDIMYEKLRAAYAAFAGTYGFDIIPTGTAVQLVRKDLPVRYAENSLGGDVVGDMRFSKKDGKWEAIGDAYHMGPDGDYLQALVWTAKLFGVDVTACTYAPPGMTAERAAFLRKTAMKAVAMKETTDFNIVDFGAKPEGEKCTASIARTIDACSRAGGGRVVVPSGRWRTGGVKLRSNCELHLAEGAVLEFSDDLDDYLPGVPVSWEGVECVNVSPLVYAYGCTNVAVTGRGTLKAKMDFWWTWAGPKKPDCEVVNHKLKNEWSPKNVPVSERQLWKEPNARFRPQFLHFNRCKDVRLEGFSVRGSPFWTIHAFLCDGVMARGLDVDATGDDGRIINNSDGFDIDATKNVLIEDCTFCQGDDALVFKSGKDFDGRRLATPTENVVVRNCTVRRGHNLAAIGSELSGGVRNIRISGCRITGAVGELLHVKTNPRRGGFVENIVIEDVEVDGLRTDVLGITSRYYFGGSGEEAFEQDFLTPIRNIVLRDIRCRRAVRRLTLRGDYLLPVENVSLRDVRIASCGEEDYIASVRNLSVDGRTVEPTIHVLTATDLGGVDVSKAIYQPESRDSVLAFTDGTVKGTVVRASRDLKTWSEPVAELWPEDEFKDAKVKSAKIRRETDGWYMDVEFAGEKRTYYTPEVFWPFRPRDFFGESHFEQRK